MEIRDPIHGSLDLSKEEEAIIQTPSYQRLRFIKQLGFTEFSFPGATHNRFLHSIGVSYLSGLCFDSIFKDSQFNHSKVKNKYRALVKLAALLHDVGHGPLSHTTEEVMPKLEKLDIKIYQKINPQSNGAKAFTNPNRSANHEDYSLKFITDSPLTKVIQNHYGEDAPNYLACIINQRIPAPDDFFIDQGIDIRNLLSQIVSSELDADRMDYLTRDAYFCGTNYGRVETNWLITNMTFHLEDDKAFLALNRRALYSFDDFLLSRHHMHLMVYFHHKSIIYEELLYRYLTSKSCKFFLPSDIEDYISYTDSNLFEHLAHSPNPWAQRVGRRKPYQVLFELHSTKTNDRIKKMQTALESEGVHVITANSKTRLSRYHSVELEQESAPIFVVDQYDKQAKDCPIENMTEVFKKYEEIRRIERLYTPPEDYKEAEKIIESKNL